jgi:long-chain acyl-CoA synthetase
MRNRIIHCHIRWLSIFFLRYVFGGICRSALFLADNGENVEPQFLEDAITTGSRLIDQIMLVGQDQRYLGAVINVNVPELVRLGLVTEEQATKWDPSGASVPVLRYESSLLNRNPAVVRALAEDLERVSEATNPMPLPKLSHIFTAHGGSCLFFVTMQVCNRLRPWERVSKFYVTLLPFTLANGQMTQTAKIKRYQIASAYAEEIKGLFGGRS